MIIVSLFSIKLVIMVSSNFKIKLFDKCLEESGGLYKIHNNIDLDFGMNYDPAYPSNLGWP